VLRHEELKLHEARVKDLQKKEKRAKRQLERAHRVEPGDGRGVIFLILLAAVVFVGGVGLYFWDQAEQGQAATKNRAEEAWQEQRATQIRQSTQVNHAVGGEAERNHSQAPERE